MQAQSIQPEQDDRKAAEEKCYRQDEIETTAEEKDTCKKWRSKSIWLSLLQLRWEAWARNAYGDWLEKS